MAEPQNCPSRDELQRLVLGQLPGLVADRIQQHLEQCPKCWSAFDDCVNSEGLLNAVRAQRGTASEPTKTLYLPIECLRSALATWTHDKTQSDNGEAPFSVSEITRHLAPAQAADEIGRLGDFRVLRVLGAGGFAVVFDAEDIRLKRHVALKLMHPVIAARHADRFLREAQSAAALKHEHVVTIYQVGMHGDTPFIALELLHGETLEDHLIRESRLSVQEAVRIGREIASGLAAAHARGLLHRDIKPANIWLEGPEKAIRKPLAPQDNQLSTSVAAGVEPGPLAVDGGRMAKVKILDFGCAKSWADDSAISDRGMLIGTPAYMAPEQLAGEAVDPRADLFSLGCLLYRMAAGKRPFSGNNLFSVVRALALEDPAPLETVNPQVPHALSELVKGLLAKCPDERPASALIVVDQLRAIEDELPRQQVVEGARQISEKARPTDATTSGGPRKRGNKSAIAAGLGLAVLLAVAYFLFGAQLIRIATDKGQVVIAVDDPNVTVTVKEGLIVVHDGQGRAEITLGAGDHQLEVTLKQPTGDATFKTDKFALSRGGRKVFEAREELAKVAESPTPALPPPRESRTVGTIAKERKPQGPAVADLDRPAAEWVLSQRGGVTVRAGQPPQAIQLRPGQALPPSNLELTSLEFESDGLTDAGLDHLRGLHHLVDLKLGGRQITGSGFQVLRDLTELKTLVIRNAPVRDAALQHIEGLPKLECLSLDGTHVTDAGLVHLKPLTHLRELNLSWTHVTDKGLKQLAEELPQLESLYLRGRYLSDAGLAHLHGFKNLRTLYLSGQPLTDAGLAHILELEHLMGLGLSSTQVTEAGFARLTALKNLRNLNLERTRVTDAIFPHLKGLPELEDLTLGGTHVTEAGLAGLQRVANLRFLSLKGSPQLSDAAVPQLLKLRSLTEIDLSDTGVSAKEYAALKTGLPGLVRLVWADANATTAKAVLAARGSVEIRLAGTNRSVQAIAELPSEPFQITGASLSGVHTPFAAALTALSDPKLDGLVSLNLSGTVIKDDDWLRLKKMAHLRSLVLEGNALRESDLVHLGELTNLEELVLHRAQIADSWLSHLRGLTKLTSLAINRTRLTDAGLAHLADLKSLKDLNLNNTAVTDAGVTHLAGLTELKSLVLEATRVSDAGLKQLLPLKNLESLWLGHGTAVTDAGAGLLAQMKNLRVLALTNTQVTDAGLAQLKDLTQLETLFLAGTRVTDAGLVHVRRFKKLRILSLKQLPVTDRGLANLEDLTDLRQLVLDHTRVTDEGLAHLKGLTRLGLLDLSGTRVTQASLAGLEGFKNLRVLALRGLPRVGDTAIPRFLHLPSLLSLDLLETHVSARGLEILKTTLPKVSVLWSEPNVRVARAILAAGGRVDVRLEETGTERAIKAASELPRESFQITRARVVGSRSDLYSLLAAVTNPRLEGLVSLDLSDTAVDDSDLERLKALVGLRQLNLAKTRVTDAGLESLEGWSALRQLVLDGDAIRGSGLMHLQKLAELTELRLGSRKLTELFLLELGGLKKLERLSLADSTLTDEGALHLASVTHLKELDLSHTQVTTASVAKLKASLPQCRIVTTIPARQLSTP